MNDTTKIGCVEDSFGSFENAIDKCDRVQYRISRNKIFDIPQIVSGGQRPTEFRHRAILSFNSSWLTTCPSATS